MRSSSLLLALCLTACRGLDGSPGPTGPAGADGVDGTNGNDGHNALIEMRDEEPGENCSDGGVAVVSGTDANAHSDPTSAKPIWPNPL